MNASIESDLRRTFAEDSTDAVGTGTVQAAAARRRVRGQRAFMAAAAVAVAVMAPVGVGEFLGPDPSGPGVAQAPDGAPSRSGPLDLTPDTASCAEEYSARTLADRAIALDATVQSIAEAPSDRPGNPEGYVEVTLGVTTWFAGGQGDTTTVLMAPPQVGPTVEDSAIYSAGTRLLVSGEFLRNGNPVAWGCGFTRYYDPNEVGTWSGIAWSS